MKGKRVKRGMSRQSGRRRCIRHRPCHEAQKGQGWDPCQDTAEACFGNRFSMNGTPPHAAVPLVRLEYIDVMPSVSSMEVPPDFATCMKMRGRTVVLASAAAVVVAAAAAVAVIAPAVVAATASSGRSILCVSCTTFIARIW